MLFLYTEMHTTASVVCTAHALSHCTGRVLEGAILYDMIARQAAGAAAGVADLAAGAGLLSFFGASAGFSVGSGVA